MNDQITFSKVNYRLVGQNLKWDFMILSKGLPFLVNLWEIQHLEVEDVAGVNSQEKNTAVSVEDLLFKVQWTSVYFHKLNEL